MQVKQFSYATVELYVLRLRSEKASEHFSQIRDYNKFHKGFNNLVMLFLCVISGFCLYTKCNNESSLPYALEYRLCIQRQSFISDLEI